MADLKTAKDGTYYRDERNGAYCWKLRVGSGEDVRNVVRKAKTQRELKAKIEDALKEVNARGTVLERVDREMTVGAWLTTWLADFVGPSRALKTYRQYEQVVRLYAIPAIGGIRMDRLKTVDVQRMLNGMAERGLSSTTINTTRTIVKRALTVARNQTPPLIVANPAEGTEPAKSGLRKKRTMPEESIDALLVECFRTKEVRGRGGNARTEFAYRDGPMIAYLLSTGLRISEGCGQAAGDVFLLSSPPMAHVRRKITHLPGGAFAFEVPKTARSVRTVPLAGIAIDALKARAGVAAIDRERAGDAYLDGGLLWATESGRPVSPRNVQRSLTTILDALKLPHYSLHDLRRSFGTHLARKHVPAHVLQAIMGHESIKTTNEHYLTAFMGDMTKAVEAFEGRRPELPRTGAE